MIPMKTLSVLALSVFLIVSLPVKGESPKPPPLPQSSTFSKIDLQPKIKLPKLPPVYPAEVISIYDGDTFDVRIQPLPDLFYDFSVRVSGIDTPEMKGACEKERALAKKAKELTTAFIYSGSIELRNFKSDKYSGRIVAEVWSNGTSLAQELINEKYAYKYDGGAKLSWCN